MLKFLLLLGCTLVFAHNSDVLEFTDDNFEEQIKPYDILLVKFYAPWCGHCKKLAPELERAAAKLKGIDHPVHIAKVDCTKETKTCEKFGVSGYPTLKIFRGGALSQDYDGPREAEGIVKYMRSQAGPSAVEVKDIKQFEKAVAGDDVVIFGFFETDSKLKDSYLKVADTERDRYQFMYTSDEALIKKFGHTDDIVAFAPKNLHNKFEPEYFKYDGNYDTDKIKEFLLHETTGLAGVRTAGNIFHFDRKPLVVVYCKIDYTLDPKGSKYWRNRVLMVAKDFKRKVHFAVSNKEDFSHEITEYGLSDRKESSKPLVGAQTKDGKFTMTEEFSVDNLKEFVNNVLAGKLEPYMKSEPIPETQGVVKTVVAKNFNQIVEEDTLLVFYAPWCGHCKSLLPKLEELGEKLSNEPGVMIGKMDATANDVPPGFEVKGFPTIYWVPKDSKDKPVSYDGGREVDDFVKYIAKHSTGGLEGYDRNGKKKSKQEL